MRGPFLSLLGAECAEQLRRTLRPRWILAFLVGMALATWIRPGASRLDQAILVRQGIASWTSALLLLLPILACFDQAPRSKMQLLASMAIHPALFWVARFLALALSGLIISLMAAGWLSLAVSSGSGPMVLAGHCMLYGLPWFGLVSLPWTVAPTPAMGGTLILVLAASSHSLILADAFPYDALSLHPAAGAQASWHQWPTLPAIREAMLACLAFCLAATGLAFAKGKC